VVSTSTVEDTWGNKFIVFTVPLPNREPVFMSLKVTPYNNDKRGVVIVDAEKFLRLWRNEPYSVHGTEAHGNPQTWPKDRKYAAAEKGFSYGQDNPVPLAYVSYGVETRTVVSYKFLWFGRAERREQFSYVAFTNGITRTIWLLTQGCKHFPVECEMPGACALHRVASVAQSGFFTVDQLASVPSCA
jgi:hypothetical protein